MVNILKDRQCELDYIIQTDKAANCKTLPLVCLSKTTQLCIEVSVVCFIQINPQIFIQFAGCNKQFFA